MLHILTGIPVAPYFTLSEALYWVACKQYVDSSHFIDTFLEPEGNENNVIDALFNTDRAGYSYCEEDFNRNALEKLGFSLPEAPVPPVDNFEGMDEEEAKRILHEHEGRCHSHFAECYDIEQYCFAPFKSALFLKLRSGEIPAYGQLLGKYNYDLPTGFWRASAQQTDKAWEKIWRKIEYDDSSLCKEDIEHLSDGKSINGFQKIPAEFWDIDGIRWREDDARSRFGWFHWIFLSSESLFAHFPHVGGKPMAVENRAGYLIYDDKSVGNDSIQHIKSQPARGRPAYNWPEFRAELTRYCIDKGQIPKLQKDVEHHMQDWCQKQWGKTPSHGAIHTEISPLYAEKKKVKKSA